MQLWNSGGWWLWKTCLEDGDEPEGLSQEPDDTYLDISVFQCDDTRSEEVGRIPHVAFDGDGPRTVDRPTWETCVKHLFSAKEGLGELPQFEAASQVKLISQKDTWDCGVACLQMILHWLRETNSAAEKTASGLEEERATLLRELGTESIWTVDLVCLLDQLLQSEENVRNTRILFCSESFQVNQVYGTFDYYQSTFDNDTKRVQNNFHALKKRCIPSVHVGNHLPLAEVVRLVNHPDCLAMALVDNSILRKTKVQEQHSETLSNSSSYAGHYILISGFSRNEEHIKQAWGFYELDEDDTVEFCLITRNPALPETMYLTPHRFEQAWRALGTDADILFVVRAPSG